MDTASEVGDDKGKLATKPDDVIAECKKRLELCIDADGDNHNQGLDDLKFLSGDQWDEKAIRQRKLDGRPCLTINKLPTFLHQVTNDLRQNVPGIKISPVDDGADIETAEVIQGMIRHIEYSSNADVAYDTAVGNAASIGFGYFRLVTDFCYPDSFDQDIKFKRIRNPFTVYCDPASEEPDGSDAKFWIISSDIPKNEFLAEYPDAEMTYEGFDTGPGDPQKSQWLTQETVKVAEYYRIVLTPDTLVELSNGETGYKSKLIDMPKGVSIKRERATQRKSVEWKKLTSLEVLEETEIKCEWIPVFPVYGDELDIDGKVIRSGLVRNAKSPGQMYNVWMTTATEEIGMRNKTPYIGAEGQFEGFEDDWEQANVRNFPFLEYKPITVDGTIAPAPQRQPMSDVPQGVLTMALHASDDIKATTGLFDSSLGARGNATSGIQERAQQRQGDIANFHYADNLTRSIRQAGRCLISMIPNYYDAERVVRIMGDDGKLSHATINQPTTQMQPVPQGQPPPPNAQPDPKTGEMMMAVDTMLHDMSVGEYDVTVSTGPSYSTMRQEAADAMISMSKSWPKLMDVAGDKVVAAMDWPGAEGIAARLKATIPPQILANDPESKDEEEAPMVQTPKGPIPLEQASQMLQEMDQQIQGMGQQLQEAKSGVTSTQIKAQSDENTTRMKIESDERIRTAEIAAEQQREVARVAAEAARTQADGDIKKDIAELNGVVALLVAKAKVPPALEGDAENFVDSAGAPKPKAQDETAAMLKQLLAQQSQPREPVHIYMPGAEPQVPKPSKRTLSIKAPSGKVYTGEINDGEK